MLIVVSELRWVSFRLLLHQSQIPGLDLGSAGCISEVLVQESMSWVTVMVPRGLQMCELENLRSPEQDPEHGLSELPFLRTLISV